VGSAAKLAVVEARGSDVAVDYGTPGWVDRVRDALGERRVTLALDGIGGDTGRAVFELIGPGGRMVIYGMASGEPMPLSVRDLFVSGITVSAPIGVLARRPDVMRRLAGQALGDAAAGRLEPAIHPPFSLADAARAHRALEQRETIGKVVLVP
jgi:NADPH2:quinone reductase